MVGSAATCFFLVFLASLSPLETVGCSTDGLVVITILRVTEKVVRHGEW